METIFHTSFKLAIASLLAVVMLSGSGKQPEQASTTVSQDANSAANSSSPSVTPAQARAIGIEKGKPFNPDEKLKRTLTEAVAVGNAAASFGEFVASIGSALRPTQPDFVVCFQQKPGILLPGL
jgi:hypothetical protein